MVTIQFIKLTSLATVPTRGSDFAAGYDLYSTEDYKLDVRERKLFKTNLSIAIPKGLYGRIAPRSGLAFKDGLDVMAGVIDEDYRGDVGVILINLGDKAKEIKAGDKIAQIIFENYTAVKFTETDDLSKTARDTKGYGSTDPDKGSPEGTLKAFKTLMDGMSPTGTPLSELYQKSGGVQTKKRYTDEIKEREQQ